VIAADAGRHLGDNPIVSAIFVAYALDEPITINLVLGLLLVAIGIGRILNVERRWSGWVTNRIVPLRRLNLVANLGGRTLHIVD
jgi:hypothetical protein